jgi:hypothetical protein
MYSTISVKLTSLPYIALPNINPTSNRFKEIVIPISRNVIRMSSYDARCVTSPPGLLSLKTPINDCLRNCVHNEINSTTRIEIVRQ